MKQQEKKSRRYFLKIIFLLFLSFLAIIYYKGWVHRPRYNAAKIAASETAMWKAYYAGEKKKLVWELVNLQRTQFRMTLLESLKVSKELGEAAYVFSKIQGNYEEAVLPFLVRAYTSLKEYSKQDFDAQSAARAELAWWVARRTPGQNSPEQVGREIAGLYAILYGEDNPSFHKAGLLRAQAAYLRDREAGNPDWQKIEALLRESYESLVQGLD